MEKNKNQSFCRDIQFHEKNPETRGFCENHGDKIPKSRKIPNPRHNNPEM